MRASFMATHETNQTAYISINTSEGDTFKIPMEVHVTSKPALYFSMETLDFGTMRTNDETRKLAIFALNSGPSDLVLKDVKVDKSNPAVSVQFRSMKLLAQTNSFTLIANVSFTAGLMTSLDDCKGRVVVSVKEDDQFASLPFEARVLEGSVFERYASLTFSCFTDFSTLGWNDSSTSFTLQYPKRSDDVINEDSSYLIRRNIELINSFDFPLLIHKIQSNHTDLNPLFQVITSGESFLLPPLNLTTCFTIACAVSSARDVMNREGVTSLTRHIHVYTNASLFSIPVVLFTNHLQYKIRSEDDSGKKEETTSILDFDVIAVAQQRSKILILQNLNPSSVSFYRHDPTRLTDDVTGNHQRDQHDCSRHPIADGRFGVFEFDTTS